MKSIKLFSFLLLLSFCSCNINRMGIYNGSSKKTDSIVEDIRKEDTFTLVNIAGDSLPAIGMFNERLVNFAGKDAYPWNCSVVIKCKDVYTSGLPTDAEAEVLNSFEDYLEVRIADNRDNPNAIFFGRLSWNSTRELIWKVKDPKPVAAFLQSVMDDTSAVREIDFIIEIDKDWKLTEMYSNAIRKKIEINICLRCPR